MQFFLCCVRVSREFASNLNGCAARHKIKNGSGDKLVGEDEVGAADCFQGGGGEEVWVARAGASEDDAAVAPAGVDRRGRLAKLGISRR